MDQKCALSRIIHFSTPLYPIFTHDSPTTPPIITENRGEQFPKSLGIGVSNFLIHHVYERKRSLHGSFPSVSQKKNWNRVFYSASCYWNSYYLQQKILNSGYNERWHCRLIFSRIALSILIFHFHIFLRSRSAMPVLFGVRLTDGLLTPDPRVLHPSRLGTLHTAEESSCFCHRRDLIHRDISNLCTRLIHRTPSSRSAYVLSTHLWI